MKFVILQYLLFSCLVIKGNAKSIDKKELNKLLKLLKDAFGNTNSFDKSDLEKILGKSADNGHNSRSSSDAFDIATDINSAYSCDFTKDNCDWTNEKEDQIQWVKTDSGITLQSSPKKQDISRFVSPEFKPLNGGQCFRFQYKIDGDDPKRLLLKVKIGDTERLIWSRTGYHGDKFYNAMATIDSSFIYHLILEADTGLKSIKVINNYKITQGVCVSNAPPCGSVSDTERVLNGIKAKPGRWPFMVHLLTIHPDDSPTQCGGSLIHPQWVFSAAHCFENDDGDPVKTVELHFGETNLFEQEDSNFVLSAKDVFIHPLRFSGPYRYDAALIKLPYPIHLNDKVNTVCLPDYDMFPPGTVCNGIGWGLDATGGATDDLFYTEQKIIDLKTCNDHFEGRIKDDMICSGSQKRQTVCAGDSGGPLACKVNGKYFLAGATSFGPGCDAVNEGKEAAFSVFARVSYLNSWIQETIASNTDSEA